MDAKTLAVVVFGLLSSAVSAQKVYVATPSMIRLSVEEHVAIAVDDTTTEQQFELSVQDHPGRRKILSKVSSTIMPLNPKIVSFTINPSDVQDLMFTDVPLQNFVNLSISSANFHKSVILPVSYKAGFVFIQSDKPIYTPKQRVEIRIIPLNENGKPSPTKLKLQIKNPKGIVVKESELGGKIFTRPEDYIQSVEYTFSNHPLLGIWSATVLYGYQMQENTTIHFELQEYVLPFFIVKVTTQEVIMPADETIQFSVDAKYVYGKPVTGSLSFRFGVKGEAPDVTYFNALYSELTGGSFSGKVPTDQLKNHRSIGWFPDIEGAHFVLEVTVTDDATGQKEVVVDSSGQFSKSPFVISFKRCLNDFKPGLVSVIEADITYVGGKPASNIRTIISAVADGNIPMKITHPVSISDVDGKVLFEIQPEIHRSTVMVTVTTDDPKFQGNQAAGNHLQTKFQSRSMAYIAIPRKSRELPKPGELFKETIFIEPTTIPNIYFMVISKGKILFIEKVLQGQYLVHRVQFMVTQEMVPSFRLLVFAEYENELITDSLHIDVADVCDPKADVKIITDDDPKEPGSTIKVWVEGSRSSLVGLLAVDSAVYALSERDRLTKSKMFKLFDSHDLGCGPGGGLTTESVLRNAGIVMITNNYDGKAMVSACEEKLRKKREIISIKLKAYDGFLRECCALGISQNAYKRGCSKRADIVKAHLGEQDRNCSQTFLECCLHAEEKGVSDMKLTAFRRGQTARIGSGIDETHFVSINNEEKEENEVAVRRDFRESWMFNEVVLRSDEREEFEYTLPDSITTWIIQGVAVSQLHGMCVASPRTLKTFKNVFLKLNLPYSVVKNEQIEIRATVFNYGDKNVSALVYMYGVNDLCSGTQEGEKSERKRLYISPHSAETTAFPVIPLMEGTYDIKVVALSFSGSDIVIEKLNVVAEGETVEKDVTVILDPSNQQRRKRRDVINSEYSDSIDDSQNLQVTTVKLKAPDDFIPGTESCTVTAMGDQYGPTVETSLENPDKLIDKPRGCAEQAMIYLAPALYTMRYLKDVNKVTPELEAKGYELIRQGYDLVLSYRKDDGSYGAYITTPSSTWLTAFITKVFCQARNLVYIDETAMCSGVKWLISGLQEDGSFIELNPIYHSEMMGGVQGKTPLTAFVLITLAECNCDFPNIHIIRARALAYLEEHLGDINEPLPVAITAYALALMDSELKHATNDKLLALSKHDEGSNTLFWETESSAHDIETSSYGLLTQLMLLKMDKSNSVVNWLNTKRMATGSFKSTQDTVVGLQALSEYAIRAKAPGLSLVTNITSSNDINILKTFNLDEKNSLVLQEHKINKLGGTLFINTAGHGVGFLNVKLRYNVPHPPEKFKKFDVKVKVTSIKENPEFAAENKMVEHEFKLLPSDMIRAVKGASDVPPIPIEVASDVDPQSFKRSRIGRPRPAGNRRSKRADKTGNSNAVYKINICIRYLGDHEKGMTIVDTGLFTGFKPNDEDLIKLARNKSNLIDTYEKSSRGVVFYLRQAPKDEPFCFDFRNIRDYDVGNIRSAIVKVYSYYDPDEYSTAFYSPDQNSPVLRKLCDGGICQCAEGSCPPKRPFKNFRSNRVNLKLSACEDHDYVWIVNVTEPVSREDGFLRLTLRVEEVVKEGIEKKSSVVGEVRVFLARDNCESAELLHNKEYMIMGKDGKQYENEKEEKWHRYLLDKTSKIHIWTDIASAKQQSVMRALHWLKTELQEGCDL